MIDEAIVDRRAFAVIDQVLTNNQAPEWRRVRQPAQWPCGNALAGFYSNLRGRLLGELLNSWLAKEHAVGEDRTAGGPASASFSGNKLTGRGQYDLRTQLGLLATPGA